MAIAILENNGLRKEVKLGFSWTTFFFGWFVPLLRGDAKNAIIFLVGGLLAGALSSFTFGLAAIGYVIFIALKYNQMYAKSLIEKGWRPVSDTDKQLLTSNGVTMHNE